MNNTVNRKASRQVVVSSGRRVSPGRRLLPGLLMAVALLAISLVAVTPADAVARTDINRAGIEQLIEFRRKREKLVACEEIVHMPTDFGEFDLHLYRSTIDGQHHLALVKGSMSARRRTLVRVHSECLTGDVFGSRRCDCGPQLQQAMKQVSAAGHGVILYMRQEGRGIGLHNKFKAYSLQDQGLDTVDANETLGFEPDLRHYGVGVQILRDLGVRKLDLLTNNPKKVAGLSGFDLEIVNRIPVEVEVTDENRTYMKIKKSRMGHILGNC